ncbi:MAG: D-aminoacylase [Alphaproteobacteria bacterium]|nr:D-aminoacylase [Alphaproteobacteria bacterium]
MDIIIAGGTLVDGTGAKRLKADLAIGGNRIVSIGPAGAFSGKGVKQIDATGRIVAPGFIDVHTHDDNAVLISPDMTAKISQGVTTVIVGNCGISLSPIAPHDPVAPLTLLGERAAFRFSTMGAYAQAVDAARPCVNVAALVGHSTLRIGALADIGKKASASELDLMRERLSECLSAGAIGFSTGLWYKTNAAADMDEVVGLAELLSDVGGVYATHMRDEHDGILDSLYETFETANRAQVPVVISHHKCAGRANWGRSRETLPVIEKARAKQAVSLDVYPYIAGSTVLEPETVDPDTRIMVTWSKTHPEMALRDLGDIAREWGCSQADAAGRLRPAGGIFFQMDEADMRRILSYGPTMIGSDGLPHDINPHPRLWGTFPRVLGHFCRDEGLFGLEEAVHKMTGLSAKNFGLTDRGVLREGAFADVVIFDADTIIDTATYENPVQPAAGIDHVLVGGTVSWSAGGHTGHRAGGFIRRG